MSTRTKITKVGRKRLQGAVCECVNCGCRWVSRPRTPGAVPTRCPSRTCTTSLWKGEPDGRTRVGQLAAFGIAPEKSARSTAGGGE